MKGIKVDASVIETHEQENWRYGEENKRLELRIEVSWIGSTNM